MLLGLFYSRITLSEQWTLFSDQVTGRTDLSASTLVFFCPAVLLFFLSGDAIASLDSGTDLTSVVSSPHARTNLCHGVRARAAPDTPRVFGQGVSGAVSAHSNSDTSKV
nr:hypothetical protein BgiMline_027883 [Biomphalaria glabrata]